MATSDDKTMGMACHLASLAGYVIPFGHIIGPLIIWMLKKDTSSYVDWHGKESLNFQISVTLYLIALGIVSAILMVIAIGVLGFALMGIIPLAQVVLAVIAAIKAYNGEQWQYPATIRFIK